MAITFRILNPHGLIAIAIAGRIRFEDMRNVANDLSSDPDFVRSYDRIIFVKEDANFSEMTLSKLFDVKEVMKNAFLDDLGATPSKLPAYRVAVVCSSTINEIVMQLFGALWETEPNPVVSVGHFEMVSDGLIWLGRETIPESEFRDELIGV